LLTYLEVKPTCIFWANKYKSKNFEFDELFNVGYLVAIKQTTVLTLQKSIKGALLRFMLKRQKFTAQCRNFESDNLNSGEENDKALCSKENCIHALINSEELLAIIKEAKIEQSTEFLEILYLVFVKRLTQKDIAKKYNVRQQTISYTYNVILDKLITVNKRRMSCQK